MSAILAAIRARTATCVYGDLLPHACPWCRAATGTLATAVNRASNAAQAGRVVRGAPRTWAVRWYRVLSDKIAVCADDPRYVQGGHMLDLLDAPHSEDLRPTWCPLSSLWLWSTAAHDQRGCEMPRAGEVRRG